MLPSQAAAWMKADLGRVGRIKEGGQLTAPYPNQSQSFLQDRYTGIGAVIVRLGFSKGFKLSNRTHSHQLLLGLFCWEILVRAAATEQLLTTSNHGY